MWEAGSSALVLKGMREWECGVGSGCGLGVIAVEIGDLCGFGLI